uniref:Uncharacterized protein n=1 Tax=Timema cristinae TaxID=61476 RepID=A0A7R9H9T3_TIMCR|nr:unnamed protein product [Timema cristinae]
MQVCMVDCSQFLQLNKDVSVDKDERLSNYEGPKGRALMQDSLQLRFSLVGGMFDTIQRNTTVTTDWAILLVQLITYGVIDLNNNSELFTTVLDMLATLIHSTLVSDSQIEKEDSRKHYQNLMKKLKKVILLNGNNLESSAVISGCHGPSGAGIH